MENRVKFRVGEIEFEAEGSAEVVERERNIFLEALLPAAVKAIVSTRGSDEVVNYVDSAETAALLPNQDQENKQIIVENGYQQLDLSRTSLASFLKKYGSLSDQDFVIISAYYYELKNGTGPFSNDTVKEYYGEARRSPYSNNSALLQSLAKKGLIMDDPNAEIKTPKQYILTEEGLEYVKSYKPKDENIKPKTSKKRKKKSKIVSEYASLCADDLNLSDYPEIGSQSSFKKQMLLLMYIVTKEEKGNSFSVLDIKCLMTDKLGLPATNDQINGVFKNNKTWFKSDEDPDNKKAYKRILLQGALKFAESIIEEDSANEPK